MASDASRKASWWLGWAFRLYLIKFILYSAYDIRLYAIKSYGLVIHEFDPWFNFRATQ